MKGKHKKFDQELYDQNDAIAKRAVMSYINQKFPHCICMENPIPHDIDLIVYSKNDDLTRLEKPTPVQYIEVARKPSWEFGYEPFPYNSINIEERKKKYMNLDAPSVIFAVSADCMGMFFMDLNKAKDHFFGELENRLVHSGELFWRVPLSEWTKVHKDPI